MEASPPGLEVERAGNFIAGIRKAIDELPA
jgi:hypothetical protein